MTTLELSQDEADYLVELVKVDHQEFLWVDYPRPIVNLISRLETVASSGPTKAPPTDAVEGID